MSFPFSGQARLIFTLCALATLLSFQACHRAGSKEEKALRAELRQALRDRSFQRAAELARRASQARPQDNGNWDRLVQAEFGMRDLNAVKQTLQDWRRTVKKPSLNLEEYSGDLALEKKNSSDALQAWSKIIGLDPKNTRVLEKIARLEHSQHHWPEENAAWSASISVHEDAMARLHRALCRRHLHRWEEATEDLHRAQELAPDDAEVQRGGRLFERIGKFLAEIRELDAALAVTPNDPGLLADRALMFLRSEDYELALEDSESAAKTGPWAVRPKLFQALALIAMGRADECGKLGVEKFIRLDGLTPEFLETISRLDSEISVEPKNAELYVSRAWQLNEISQPSLALQDAETAARLDPKSAGALVEQSYALRKLGRGAEGFEQIKHATELDARLPAAWQYRGELEMERGEILSAIESLSHALDANRTATALRKREECYRRLGLLVKAEQDHRALQELDAHANK